MTSLVAVLQTVGTSRMTQSTCVDTSPPTPKNDSPIVPAIDLATKLTPDAADDVVGSAFPPETKENSGVLKSQLSVKVT